MKIRVECYSGRKAHEHPVKFWLGDVVLFVEPVEEWSTTEAVYFRVLADDGNTYVLRHNEWNAEWTLESFRSYESPASDLCFDPPPGVH
jgi:hypothetical protein